MKIFSPLTPIYRVGTALVAGCLTALFAVAPGPAQARFGMIIPSANQVDDTRPEVTITFSFSHPFENIGVDLAWPAAVFVSHAGDERQDLKGTMLETTAMDHQAWKLDYSPPGPGVYWFAMEQAPYWDQAADRFVVNHTKTALIAYGKDTNWDRPLGVKTEIVPLLRPFGNYAGNTFVGRLLLDGTATPGALVEIEHYNQERWVAASATHVTQVVKTDDNGIFSFTCPLPGWWGFSGLSQADYTLKDTEGKDKPVQLGAVIWVYFDPNPFTGQ